MDISENLSQKYTKFQQKVLQMAWKLQWKNRKTEMD